MILTCPACATRYFVDAAKVGPEGKTVRCASCATTWRADAEAISPEPLPTGTAEPAGSQVADSPEPVASAASPSAAAPTPALALELPKAFRARANQRRVVRSAVVHGVVWGGLAASVSAVAVLGALFRDDVVRHAPRAAGLYAAIGMPVNPTGLALENVMAQPALQDGHAALMVSGVIRNINDRAVTAPPLKISVLDQGGQPVKGKLAEAGAGKIAPGETRHFMVALIDPPRSAKNIDVSFAVGAKTIPAKAAARSPAAAKPVKASDLALRMTVEASPPAPAQVIHAVDAVPLDSHSPYALPDRG